MKFIYRGIRYQSNLRNSCNSNQTIESKPGIKSKTPRIDFFTYRGVSYTKYFPTD